MVQTVAIERLTLISLMNQFGLVEADDNSFFSEWQTSLPSLSDYERDRLERIRATYRNFEARDALENTVGLTVVSPLIDTAGLFLPPFYVETEKSVEVTVEDKDLVIRGCLDVVVIKNTLWVLTIEAKRAGLSLTVGIPQVLAYMLAAPTSQHSLYGMVTNGRNFIFVKLDRSTKGNPLYAQSKEFVIRQDNDLEQVFKIIKRLASVIAS